MTLRSFAVVACFLLLLFAAPGFAAAGGELSLLVHVVDGEGRPVVGATVRAASERDVDREDEPRPSTVSREKTSDKGLARVAGLPSDRTIWLVVEHKGFTPEVRSFSPASEARREVRVTLKPGRTAVGEIVDEKGRPVAGAEVELSGEASVFEAWERPSLLDDLAVRRARSGRAGRFRFQDLPEVEFELTIRHPDFAPFSGERPVEGSASGRLGKLVLRRGKTLQGTVVNPTGQPVAGAKVWAVGGQDDSTELSAPAATSSDGTFSIPHQQPADEAGLWVCADGFLMASDLVPFSDDPVRVTLQPASAIRGRVLGPDGQGVAGATVEPFRIGSGGCSLRYETPCPSDERVTADAGGWFSLPRLTPGWHLLTATAPGLVEGTSAQIRARAVELVEEVEIRLRKGVAVSGRIVDPRGEPVAGAEVGIWLEESSARATSREDGSFQIDGIASGTASLRAWAAGYAANEGEIEIPDDGLQTEVVLTPESKDVVEVYGRVLTADGSPVEAALVSSGDQRVHSAWDGSFSLRLCACKSDHPQLIRAEKRGFARGLSQVRLEGRRVDGVEVRLGGGALVSGRILGLEESALRRARVTFSQQGEDFAARVDGQGSFRIDSLPAGAWQVSAEAEKRKTEGQLVVEPGQAEAFVELTFPPTREVRGRVLDADGEPAGGAVLVFLDAAMNDVAGGWTRPDGTFSAQVSAGDFELNVVHGELRHSQPLRMGDSPVTDLEIRLSRGARISGQVLGLSPWDLPHITLSRANRAVFAQADDDGGWSAEGLAPGTWELEAIHWTKNGRTLKVRQTFEVSAGTSEIRLDLDFTGAGDPEGAR